MIGLAVLVLSHQHWASMNAADRATFDPTNDSFAGLAIGQLAVGVLGRAGHHHASSPRG